MKMNLWITMTVLIALPVAVFLAGNLPRLVLGPGDYFLDPVPETIHLDPAALVSPASAAVIFGACLPVTGICVLEEVEVTLTRGADGNLDLGLAMLAP